MIRTYQPSDEAGQVGIYNEAAASLPKFKPATLDEWRRRCRAADFDPATRFFAIEDGQPVGYASFHANGRISYPWCRQGYERLAEIFEECSSPPLRLGTPTTLQAGLRTHEGLSTRDISTLKRLAWTLPDQLPSDHGFAGS